MMGRMRNDQRCTTGKRLCSAGRCARPETAVQGRAGLRTYAVTHRCLHHSVSCDHSFNPLPHAGPYMAESFFKLPSLSPTLATLSSDPVTAFSYIFSPYIMMTSQSNDARFNAMLASIPATASSHKGFGEKRPRNAEALLGYGFTGQGVADKKPQAYQRADQSDSEGSVDSKLRDPDWDSEQDEEKSVRTSTSSQSVKSKSTSSRLVRSKSKSKSVKSVKSTIKRSARVVKTVLPIDSPVSQLYALERGLSRIYTLAPSSTARRVRVDTQFATPLDLYTTLDAYQLLATQFVVGANDSVSLTKGAVHQIDLTRSVHPELFCDPGFLKQATVLERYIVAQQGTEDLFIDDRELGCQFPFGGVRSSLFLQAERKAITILSCMSADRLHLVLDTVSKRLDQFLITYMTKKKWAEDPVASRSSEYLVVGRPMCKLAGELATPLIMHGKLEPIKIRKGFVFEYGDVVVSARTVVDTNKVIKVDKKSESITDLATEAYMFMLHYTEVWGTLFQSARIAQFFLDSRVPVVPLVKAAHFTNNPHLIYPTLYKKNVEFHKLVGPRVERWAQKLATRGMMRWPSPTSAHDLVHENADARDRTLLVKTKKPPTPTPDVDSEEEGSEADSEEESTAQSSSDLDEKVSGSGSESDSHAEPALKKTRQESSEEVRERHNLLRRYFGHSGNMCGGPGRRQQMLRDMPLDQLREVIGMVEAARSPASEPMSMQVDSVSAPAQVVSQPVSQPTTQMVVKPIRRLTSPVQTEQPVSEPSVNQPTASPSPPVSQPMLVCPPVQLAQSVVETVSEPIPERAAIPTQPSPAQDCEPVSEPSPAQDCEPVSEPSPAQDCEPVSEPSPAQDCEPVSEPSPAQDSEPVSEPSPAQDCEPVSEPSPAQDSISQLNTTTADEATGHAEPEQPTEPDSTTTLVQRSKKSKKAMGAVLTPVRRSSRLSREIETESVELDDHGVLKVVRTN